MVDCEDPMNSSMQSYREVLGYYKFRTSAESRAKFYNDSLSPRLRKSSFAAKVTEIEVQE
jgi:hypothetical protein